MLQQSPCTNCGGTLLEHQKLRQLDATSIERWTWKSSHKKSPEKETPHILLLESPCPFVRSSVTFFTPSNAHDISATKRATGDPLVSKRPDFWGLFGYSKKWRFEFLDFWISGFFWISGHIFGTRRATGDPLVSKRPKFLGLYRFTKKLDFLGFWISGFLDFFIFLDFWPYLWN